MKNLVLIGAGSHAKVLLEIIKEKDDLNLIGFTDKIDTKKKYGYPIIGTDDVLDNIYSEKKAQFAFIGVGGTGSNKLREDLFSMAKEIGFKFINLIHKSSYYGNDISIGKGNLLNVNTVINPGVKIGNNNIINTGSIIEHDCIIRDHIHIAPGSVLSGGVKVNNLAHIGTGATVIENINIGKNTLIGAGSVVIDDIPDNAVAVGNPAKVIRYR